MIGLVGIWKAGSTHGTECLESKDIKVSISCLMLEYIDLLVFCVTLTDGRAKVRSLLRTLLHITISQISVSSFLETNNWLEHEQ